MSEELINIPSKSKIHINWKVSPYDYSKEKENAIIYQASQKYSVPKDRIKVIPHFVILNKQGKEISIANEVVQNIQNPEFQIKLFKKFIKENNIQGYDFNMILDIDAQINSRINYDVYDKYKKYKLKWIKWKNFLSYGDDNFYDFTTLNGLVLLNGEPANQSGKTTFAIDLMHFLLFGKIEKYPTQDKIFNKHLNEATEVVVEGCIEIDGTDYVIKRRLNRPSATRRTARSKTTQKVEYYKINPDNELEQLDDYENQQEESTVQTNKVIKEAIGNEADFDMIVCATGGNLNDLIEKKETEKGRLLSRWIGLLPIEQKELIAKERFNNEIRPYLISLKYSKDEVLQEIEQFKRNIFSLKGTITNYQERLKTLTEEITNLEDIKKTLLVSKTDIDANLLKVDISTLNHAIEDIKNKGITRKEELEKINKELEELKNVDFSIEEFNKLLKNKDNFVSEIAKCRERCTTLQNLIKTLKTSEFCPTCGKKYDNVDNSAEIKKQTDLLDLEIEKGKKLKTILTEVEKQLENLKSAQELYVRKCQLEAKKGAVEVTIEQCRNSYKEKMNILTEYNKNNEAIDKNNQLDIQIHNNEVIIRTKKSENDNLIMQMASCKHDIEAYETCIKEREELIKQLEQESIKIQNWKLYLQMVGKDGISKMVLRNVIPVINSQIAGLLNGICDFTVEMDINDKNDIIFYLVKDDVRSDLSGGSGFERTAAALALRSVLGNISTLPRMSCLVLDEIWGGVAKSNYDNMRKLLEEIGKSFDFILIITHLDEVKDFCKTVITVTKKDNVSSLKTTSNNIIVK